MNENNNDTEYKQPNKSYEDLTSKCQAIVDELVDDPDRTNKAIAEAAGSTGSMIPYVEKNFGHIVEERKYAMTDAVESGATDEAMELPMPDGAGVSGFVDIQLTEEELFKCIKVLPNELSEVFFVQARTGRRPASDEE